MQMLSCCIQLQHEDLSEKVHLLPISTNTFAPKFAAGGAINLLQICTCQSRAALAKDPYPSYLPPLHGCRSIFEFCPQVHNTFGHHAYVHVTLTNSGAMSHHRWSLGDPSGSLQWCPDLSSIETRLARHTLHISRTSLPIILTQICGVCIFRLHPKKGYRTHAMITHVVLHDAHKYKRSNCHMEITRLPDVFCFLPSTACYLMKLRLTCHAAKCSWWPQSWISARQSDQNILQTFCVWMFVLIIGFPVRKHLKLHPFVTCRVLKK